MKKIGILLECSPYGGGSFQYARNLCKSIKQIVINRGVDYCFFVANNDWNDFVEGDIKKVVALSDSYIQNLIIIDKEDCDVIFATNQSDWSGLTTPIITPIHDIMHRYEPQFPEVGEYEELREREHLLYKIVENSIGILVDSNIGKQHVLEVYGRHNADKIYVLPYSVSDYLIEEGIPVDLPFEKYIFYPAQFWKHKNHRNLLYAILKLRERGIIINCVFVGSKKGEYDEILEIIEKYGISKQVSILGYVSNSQMNFLFKNARAMIMPTFFGPTNIPPMEAMFLGCPVAVSNIYGMPEQLGDAALYFDPNDTQSIASVIEKYWLDDELCIMMRNKGIERSSSFSMDRFVSDVEKIVIRLEKKLDYEERQISELLEFCRKHKKICIYGAGRYGYVLKKTLELYGISVESFFVSELHNSNVDVKYKIREFSVDKVQQDMGIICSVLGDKKNDIINYLCGNGVNRQDILSIKDETLKALKYKYV